MKRISIFLSLALLLSLAIGCMTVNAETETIAPVAYYFINDDANPASYDIRNDSPRDVAVDNVGAVDYGNRSYPLEFAETVSISALVIANVWSDAKTYVYDTQPMSIWYSTDGVSWTEATIANVTQEAREIDGAEVNYPQIATGAPGGKANREFYTFTFAENVTAKYLKIRIPNNNNEANFVFLCHGVTLHALPAVEENVPDDGNDKNPETADFAVSAVTVALVALSASAVILKKRK